VKIPSGHWILLAASGAACAIALTAPRWLPLPPADDPAFTSLDAERARLAPADDAILEGLRRRKSSQDGRGWTPENLATLRNNLGSEWQWTAGPVVERASTFVLSQEEAPQSAWPTLLRTVRVLEAQPNLVLRELEITATNPRYLRVKITLRFRLGQGNPVRPSLGPRPVSGPTFPDPGAEEVSGRNCPATPSAPSTSSSQT